jgi:hypothetical protein
MDANSNTRIIIESLYLARVGVRLKMGEGGTGGDSDILQAKTPGEDPNATGGLVASLLHLLGLWVNKAKHKT